MNTDINRLFYELQNNLGPASSSLGGVIIAVSFLEAILCFFLLIVIFRFTGDDKHHNHDQNFDGEKKY